ncbi:MAG TPA: hypothetical protein PLH83_11835 [Ruminococcus sp.]|nr:hypothetical protein [Ruminococcus sp.]
MRHYSAKKILELPRLSHLLYDDQYNFTPEKLISDLGLYEGVLIDTEEIECYYEDEPSHFVLDSKIDVKHSTTLTTAYVSEDVKALHRFLLFKNNVMLPCAECKQNQPFSPSVAFNPQLQSFIIEKDNDGIEKATTLFSSVSQKRISNRTITKNNLFDSTNIFYRLGEDKMSIYGNTTVFREEMDTREGALSCVDEISQYFSELRRDFVCSLDNSHHITAYYIIHKATDVCKDKRESVEYGKLKYCLVLEKVGQEPSMADLQMFDIEKYKKVLSSDSFRDFSMALGLHSSGVGCGSLLYLRRIYETLIKNAQDKCSSMQEWDEEEYNKRRFNEKIEYLESLGEKIIPDDLSDVKDKIYGWLSKGVHELSEQDSKELFPYLKYAIELVLDEQIAQKEKEAKLNELKRKLNK